VDDERHLSRRARFAAVGGVVCLVVAVATAMSLRVGPSDRIGLATRGPSDLTLREINPGVPAPVGSSTSTPGSSSSSSSSSTTRLGLPPIDVPPISIPGLPPLDLPPIDLDPSDDPVVAQGTLWTSDNPPPMDRRYLEPQGAPADVRGIVRNVHGVGVGGVCVEILSVVLDGDREGDTVRTDGAGRFATHVPNGLYQVTAIDCRGVQPGLAPTLRHLAVAAGQEGVVDLTATDGAGITVRVTQPSGPPRAGWCVQVVAHELATAIGPLGNVRTGADGVAVLGGLHPGQNRVVVSPDCDWANQLDGAASTFVDLPANTTSEVALAPLTCQPVTVPGHLECELD
jgi:hypothetical protein